MKGMMDWIWRIGLSIGGFIVVILIGGFLTAPFCHGRDLRAAVFLGIPLCLAVFGVGLRYWDVCRRSHIAVTAVVFVAAAGGITLRFGWSEFHELLYWVGSASLLMLLPWLLGLVAGNALRRRHRHPVELPPAN
jgi:hypothetical protein